MGRPSINLINQHFGRLLVLSRDENRPKGAGKSAYWNCKCDCGNIVSVRSDKLRNGEIISCGCYSKEVRTKLFLNDLTNKKYGNLLVLERDLTKPVGKCCFAYWNCKCKCGNIVSVRGDHLRDGTTQSCGCLNSSGELLISNLLQNHNIEYKTQYTFNDLKGDYNHLRFDFAIIKNNKLQCVIEVQGSQHYKKWGNESEERFNKRLEYDNLKRQYCNNHHIKLIEIPYTILDTLNWNTLNNLIGGDSNE